VTATVIDAVLLAFLALTAIAIARSRNLLATAMPLLPTQPVEYVPYTVPHVVTQLLLGSALAFGVLNWYPLYPPELRSTNRDFDWVYRRGAPVVVQQCTRGIVAVHGAVVSTTYNRIVGAIERLHRYHGPQGVLAQTWPPGSMALWVVILLSIVLLLFFF
jgi:multicomponent Na+:H+ antiporter subunit D